LTSCIGIGRKSRPDLMAICGVCEFDNFRLAVQGGAERGGNGAVDITTKDRLCGMADDIVSAIRGCQREPLVRVGVPLLRVEPGDMRRGCFGREADAGFCGFELLLGFM